MRLLCCAYAGGAATAYRPWSSDVSPDIEIVAVQLPGRENRLREPPLERMDDIVGALHREVRPYLDGTPLTLFGHSMGGLAAFELARALHTTYPVAHLFVSACRAPRLPRGKELHLLPHAEFLAEIRALGGTPEDVLRNEELLEVFVPLLRADLAANETYRYRPAPPLTCPITAFGGTDDLTVHRAHLESWAVETTGPFSLTMLPGGHFFIGPRRTAVTRSIETSLQVFS